MGSCGKKMNSENGNPGRRTTVKAMTGFPFFTGKAWIYQNIPRYSPDSYIRRSPFKGAGGKTANLPDPPDV
jgi:hypothetical protein